MGGQSPDPGSTATGAVFLSYASQDAEAARKICEALRGAGIEVWFDQSELRGGDIWDRKIRQQIRDCAGSSRRRSPGSMPISGPFVDVSVTARASRVIGRLLPAWPSSLSRAET